MVCIGCDSDSAENSSALPTTLPPMTGSVYIYGRVDLDPLGRIISGSESTYSDSVAETDMTLYGKMNVMRIVSSTSGDRYFNFEANGDISEYQDFAPFNPVWVTYPIQSKASQSIIIADTTILIAGQSTYFSSKINLTYEGISSMPIYDSSLVLAKTKVQAIINVVSPIQNQNDTINAYFYFSPSIGYIAKTEEDAITGSVQSNAAKSTLVSFTLK